MTTPNERHATATLPFVIEALTVRQRAAEHAALVITPKNPMVVGRERLQKLRQASGINDVERALLAEIQRRGTVRVVFFRAVDARGARVWQFDPDFDDRELEEAGYVMSHALLPLHRRMMAIGVMLMVHTEWGVRESIAMRHGIRAKLQELEQRGGAGALAEADQWLLRNMLLHTALDLNHVTESLLPPHLTLIDRRWDRVRQLVDELPKWAID